jgi:Cys-tRNA(Pro)/Cys-tRNA(Cys) deacylase
VPTAMEVAALGETQVFINGGQRGLQIQIDPNDARTALQAIAGDVIA